MKYRFRRSTLHRPPYLKQIGAKQLRLMGKDTLRALKPKSGLPAKNYYAEDMGVFTEDTCQGLGQRLADAWRRLVKRSKARIKKEPKIPTRMLWRTLGAISALTVLIGTTAIMTLFVGYSGSYTEIVIPDLYSMSANEAVSISPELFEYELIYAKNPNVPEGTVISQSPAKGVTRKLYRRNGKLKMKLTVSSALESITMPQPEGASLRELMLTLKNAGVRVSIVEEYSTTYPAGTVMSASKKSGTLLNSGDNVTLIASKGRETAYSALPDLTGMSEHAALSALDSLGLKAGKISYESSHAKLGTVITQSSAAGSKLAEGSAVDLIISGGLYYSDDR